MINLPTLEGFLAFAKAKSEDETYNYSNNEECAFSRYLQSSGYPNGRCGGSYYYLSLDDMEPLRRFKDLSPGLADALHGDVTKGAEIWTFGALAARLELLTLTARETGFPPQDAGFTL